MFGVYDKSKSYKTSTQIMTQQTFFKWVHTRCQNGNQISQRSIASTFVILTNTKEVIPYLPNHKTVIEEKNPTITREMGVDGA